MARETLKDFLSFIELTDVADGMLGVTVSGKSLDGNTYANDDPLSPGGSLKNADRSGLGADPRSGVALIGFDSDTLDEPGEGLAGRFLQFIANKAGNFYEFSEIATEGFAGARGEHLRGADEFIKSRPHVVPGTIEDGLLDSFSNSKYFDDPLTGTPESPDDELDQLISKVDGAPRGPGPTDGPDFFNQSRGANELLKDVYTGGSPGPGGGPTDFLVKASIDALN